MFKFLGEFQHANFSSNPAAQPLKPWKACRKMLPKSAELVKRVLGVCTNRSGILCAMFGATWFFHGRQWGRGAGQVNKSRKAWQFDIMHSDSTMKNLPWKNRHDLACFEKHLATEDIGFHTVRHKMWSTAGRRSPIEPRVLLWQRAAPCLHVYKMHCLCKIRPSVFRLPIIGWR